MWLVDCLLVCLYVLWLQIENCLQPVMISQFCIHDGCVNVWRCLCTWYFSNAFRAEAWAIKKIRTFSIFSVFHAVEVFEYNESNRCGIEILFKIRLLRVFQDKKMQFLKKFSLFRLQNKAPASIKPPIKSPATLDSDISGIECKFLIY